MLFLDSHSFAPWEAIYSLYILWSSGLSIYFLMATTDRDTLRGMLRWKESGPMGVLLILWGGTSMAGAAYLWPLLIIIPPVIVAFGAPWSACVTAYSFMGANIYAGGRLLQEQRAPHTG